MPGIAKIDSTITLPPMSPGSERPRIVTIGSIALRSACLPMTTRSDEALGARGLDVVLAHDLQHRLAHVAREPGEPAERRDDDRQERCARKSDCCRQNDRYSQFSERRPEIGSHPSCTPNRIIRSSASQKSGVAKPTKTKMVVTLSKIEYCRVAESTPIGTAIARMIEHLDDVEEERHGQALADLVEDGPAVGRERAPEVEARRCARASSSTARAAACRARTARGASVRLRARCIACGSPVCRTSIGIAGREMDDEERDEGDADAGAGSRARGGAAA